MALGGVLRFGPRAVAVAVAVVVVLSGLAVVFAPLATDHRSAFGEDRSPAVSRLGKAAEPRSAPASSGRSVRTASPRPDQSLDVDREGPRVFPPNPVLPSTYPGAPSAASPYVAPPAPMGVSDFGVGANGAYSYTTSSVVGYLNVTSFGAFSPTNVTNLSTPAPDWALLQLDAVAVNVSIPGAGSSPNGTYWAVNGLQLNATAAELEDNVWNFSAKGALMPDQSLSGSRGSILGPQEVYAGTGPTLAITYPLSIELIDNITQVGVHTTITFGYVVGSHFGIYDTVTFNGTASDSSPSQFLVDGLAKNPYGSYYDAEFVLGGDGYGSNANLLNLNATATLLRWNTSAGAYQAPKAAFDFGVDASETALGAAVSYTGTAVRLSPGPSFLDGLWGTDGAVAGRLAPYAGPGAFEVRVTVSPSYAFLFATNTTLARGPLRDADFSYAPTTTAGSLTTYLPPPASASDGYVFQAWADGFATANITVNTSTTQPASLTLSSSTGPYDAPVYLDGSAQEQAFVAAKVPGSTYVLSSKTLYVNDTAADLALPFLRTNEANYPTFELVATLRLTDSLVANGLTLASTIKNYTTSSGEMVPLQNWSQGYFFFYGSGHFEVANTTIQGNSTLADQVSLVRPWGSPPSTVEFYEVSAPRAANLSAIDDSVGVTALSSAGTNVTDLSVDGGALGVFSYNASGVGVDRASASGHDPYQFPSLVLEPVLSSAVVASVLSVAGGAVGIQSQNVTGLTVRTLTVTSGATGFLANYTSSGTVVGLTVGGGGPVLSTAGTWGNSSDLEFEQITVQSDALGLTLYGDSSVTVESGTSTGATVSVVQSFLNSTKGTFRDLEAENGSVAANLQNCSLLNVSDITAVGNSTGAFIANASQLSGSDFFAAYYSVALLLNDTTAASFTQFVATNDSAGVVAQNSSSLKLANISATNTSYINTTMFLTNSSSAYYQVFPIAGVGLIDDATVTVTSVSSVNYPFAVWSNHTSRLTLSEVTSWDANVSVALNWTNASTVQEVFTWGAQVGLLLANSTGTTVGASTFEASAGAGVTLDNGSADTISSDNFVGNANASYRGIYNASRTQAWSNNSTDPTFKGDYWSDWNGSVSYPINATDAVTDGHPLSGFYSTYLLFTEKGLPLDTNWSLTVGGHSYYLVNNSLLYLPGWILADGPVPFTVVPIYNYPPHPASGSVGWSGSSQSVQIFFGTLPPSGLPLPLWELGAIGAAAAAGAAGAVLVLRRRKRGPARTTSGPTDAFAPTPGPTPAGPPSPPAGGAG